MQNAIVYTAVVYQCSAEGLLKVTKPGQLLQVKKSLERHRKYKNEDDCMSLLPVYSLLYIHHHAIY